MPAQIGEPLSITLDCDQVVWSTKTKRYYANDTDASLERPLDLGRLVYYKLWDMFREEERVDVFEAFQDHMRMIVRACISFEVREGVKKGAQVIFREGESTAPDQIEATIDERLGELYNVYRRETEG